MPERLLAGRFRLLLDALFAYAMVDERKMSEFERALYAHHYDQADKIRASSAWYQAFGQDIEDSKSF